MLGIPVIGSAYAQLVWPTPGSGEQEVGMGFATVRLLNARIYFRNKLESYQKHWLAKIYVISQLQLAASRQHGASLINTFEERWIVLLENLYKFRDFLFLGNFQIHAWNSKYVSEFHFVSFEPNEILGRRNFFPHTWRNSFILQTLLSVLFYLSFSSTLLFFWQRKHMFI